MMRARVAEMFAGVGGFRLGLERAGWEVVWSNQWEPSTRVQHASECYVAQFGQGGHVCEDIEAVLRGSRPEDIPDHELLVGGFPCQDYSVAKPLPQAHGIQGKKGVLWWSIHKMVDMKRPPLILLENVDRLLKSPASRRGRDFAIILSCLNQLGYDAEWRVINAADYGFPQRRRRVFLFAARRDLTSTRWLPGDRLLQIGVFARAFPAVFDPAIKEDEPSVELDQDPYAVSERFGEGLRTSPFQNAGVMIRGRVWTAKPTPVYAGPFTTLGDVVRNTPHVPERFFISDDAVDRWAYLKGPKAEPRTDKKTGHVYLYSEGGMAFPDPLDRPARTILTGEGGSSPSRFKHVITDPGTGRLRRLTPEELEELNGFPRGWTDTGMSDTRRAFMMGNALVVGVVERLGKAIAEEFLSVLAEEHDPRVTHDAPHTAADLRSGLEIDEGQPGDEHEPGALVAASAS
ncbi:DNA cytosine methyltransferase [Coriobacteriia bacterium Es71-Z0120]|uniref:DNA cytosine methyltransferase n=1 Tax=Parvivirga hydrogeniphila TaxID=2939460 RepID=UPI002260DE81|nr:DNA (cytosine-5-)-methyltransferase [Parvivirga hydrogeniphila]MCL4078276.1 DNA cytosine methyltransferase [Parvivirga hydrogeniphila]